MLNCRCWQLEWLVDGHRRVRARRELGLVALQSVPSRNFDFAAVPVVNQSTAAGANIVPAIMRSAPVSCVFGQLNSGVGAPLNHGTGGGGVHFMPQFAARVGCSVRALQ